MGNSDENPRCCYLPDFKQLEQTFCSLNAIHLDPLFDAVPALGQCSDGLKGRTEYPIQDFSADDFVGTVKQSGKFPHNVFFVTKVEPRRSSQKQDTDLGARKHACGIIKKCADKSTRSDKVCKEVKKILGECHK